MIYVRTSKILLKIGNSISDFIKLTSNCPSQNTSGFMPILDLQVKTNENTSAVYHGESGFNGVHRLGEHETAIKNRDTKNALAKHLALHHGQGRGSSVRISVYIKKTLFGKKNVEIGPVK